MIFCPTFYIWMIIEVVFIFVNADWSTVICIYSCRNIQAIKNVIDQQNSNEQNVLRSGSYEDSINSLGYVGTYQS